MMLQFILTHLHIIFLIPCMQMTKCDVEDMLDDLFYHFDKSTKRKAELVEYCLFGNVEFRKVLKHVSTMWVSLDLVITRTLQQWCALRSYFLSEGEDFIV